MFVYLFVRFLRVGIEIPKIEVRYEHLSIEGDVYVGSRALPTLLNATLNTIEVSFWRGKKKKKNELIFKRELIYEFLFYFIIFKFLFSVLFFERGFSLTASSIREERPTFHYSNEMKQD